MYELWHTEGRGVLSAEINNFRLAVQAPERVGGAVRFMVLRRETSDGQEVLIGSGSEDNVRAAMTVAERMAERFAVSTPASGAMATSVGHDKS